MRDLKNNINVVKGVQIAAISSNTTAVSDLIDLSQYNSACIVLVAGHAYTDGTYTLTVQHGDASDGSDLATVDASLLLKDAGLGVVAAADAISRVGYIGTKKYIKLTITSTSVSSGAVVGALVVEGNPLNAPVA